MSYADDVRSYCRNTIIEPARARGEKQVEIRAGKVHGEMGYKNRLPLVCAALGANKFQEFANVERVSISGPTNGANAVFIFRIK